MLVLPVAAVEARELRVLCWSEYVPAAILQGFEREKGVKVVVEHYSSNEQMVDRLKARPSYYDVVQPSGFYVETLAAQGSLEALDQKRIPNLRHLDPAYLNLSHDPENRYSIPWLAGTVGIVVDTHRIKVPVKTWADVFSGEHAGRIVVVNDHREMVAWALASLGMPITNVSDAALQRVAPVLEKWLPQVAVFDSDSPKSALLEGRADIGIVWSGEAAALWLKDPRYRYVLPAEGTHMFLDSLCIPKGAPQKALAEEFFNYCLEPKVSVLISNEFPYTNPNRAAQALLRPEQRENPASYPPGNRKLPSLRNLGNSTRAVHEFVAQLRQRIRKENRP